MPKEKSDTQAGKKKESEEAGTGTGKSKESGEEGGHESGNGKETGQETEKKFSQAEVNSFISKEKKKWEKTKDLDENEKLKSELAETKKKLQSREAFDTFSSFAEKAGVSNPRALFKILHDDLEFDDDGNLKNPSEVLKSAKDDYPELFKKANGSGDGGSGGEGKETDKESMNDFLRS
jgi:hypothetical protein